MASSRHRSVKSAQRVIQIFQTFAERRCPQRAAQVAKALEIPISSCVFLLTTMAEAGVLKYHIDDRTYFPTAELLNLTAWLDDEKLLLEDTVRAARQLYRELGEPVAVTRRRGIFIEWLYTLRLADKSPQPGDLRPLCQTVNGIAVLSKSSDKAVGQIVDAHNDRFGKQYPIRLGDLLKQVEVARGRGYASGRSPIMPGYGAVCFAIKDERAGNELLLTIQVPTADLRRREDTIVRATKRLIPGLCTA